MNFSLRSTIREKTISADFESNAPVGSLAKTISPGFKIVLAIATLCCSPPDAVRILLISFHVIYFEKTSICKNANKDIIRNPNFECENKFISNSRRITIPNSIIGFIYIFKKPYPKNFSTLSLS